MLSSAFSNPVCEYATAIALLILALKRLAAIDLELRAHRERQRARFYEARGKAREAALSVGSRPRRIAGRQDPAGRRLNEEP